MHHGASTSQRSNNVQGSPRWPQSNTSSPDKVQSLALENTEQQIPPDSNLNSNHAMSTPRLRRSDGNWTSNFAACAAESLATDSTATHTEWRTQTNASAPLAVVSGGSMQHHPSLRNSCSVELLESATQTHASTSTSSSEQQHSMPVRSHWSLQVGAPGGTQSGAVSAGSSMHGGTGAMASTYTSSSSGYRIPRAGIDRSTLHSTWRTQEGGRTTTPLKGPYPVY